jgi:membrane protein YdbS with pleckstrin-like domain
MSGEPPPVHHKKSFSAELSFKGNLRGAMRAVTRYSWPWLLVTAALALIGIWASPALPYWGSIALGFAVAVATFVTGGLAAVRVVRQIEKSLG